MDEKTLSEIRELLRKTKRQYETAAYNELLLFNKLRNMGVDLEQAAAFAENANNLEEAICCHLQYGESTEDDIVDAIVKSIKKIKS